MSYRLPSQPSEGDVGYGRDANWDNITANRQKFLQETGINPSDLVVPRQTHGNNIEVASRRDRGKGQPPEFQGFPDTDGLITREPDVAIGIIVADCVPILLYDPAQHAAGVLHAGWRGTVDQIARNGVEAMQLHFGTLPENILAGIGPSIGPCCYEVGDEVIDRWMSTSVPEQHRAVVNKQPRSHFDLWKANQQILVDCGVPEHQIEIAMLCTACSNGKFFSHRVATSGNRPRGRMMMVAQLQ